MPTKVKSLSTDVIAIVQVPHDLNAPWKDYSTMKSRSMNKKIILNQEGDRRSMYKMTAIKDKKRIREIVRSMHSIPVMDDRPMDEILYDNDGMSKWLCWTSVNW